MTNWRKYFLSFFFNLLIYIFIGLSSCKNNFTEPNIDPYDAGLDAGGFMWYTDSIASDNDGG
jgi:hypothetical protein